MNQKSVLKLKIQLHRYMDLWIDVKVLSTGRCPDFKVMNRLSKAAMSLFPHSVYKLSLKFKGQHEIRQHRNVNVVLPSKFNFQLLHSLNHRCDIIHWLLLGSRKYSQGQLVQRSPMQTDPAQRRPAHGDLNNRRVVPQIQDETTGVFCINWGVSRLIVRQTQRIPGLNKYVFEGNQWHFYRIGLFLFMI